MKRILLCSLFVALCAALPIHAQMTVGYVPPADLVSVFDNFTRADNSTLGANWTNPGSANMPGIAGNKAYYGSGSGAAYYGVHTFNANQWSQITVTSTGGSNAVVCVRMQASGFASYCVTWQGANGQAQIVRYDSGQNPTVLASDGNWTGFAVNDTLQIRIVGSTITVYKNGSPISGFTATDSTVASGEPGIMLSWGQQCGTWSTGDL